MELSDPKAIACAFFDAFKTKSAPEMTKLYADNATFSDPVFGKLDCHDAKSMWRMLCGHAPDLQITYALIESSDQQAVVQWEANYTFSGTGRKVRNLVTSELTVANGLILRHEDQFNLAKWSAQAFGTVGRLFGSQTWFQSLVRKKAKRTLQRFKNK